MQIHAASTKVTSGRAVATAVISMLVGAMRRPLGNDGGPGVWPGPRVIAAESRQIGLKEAVWAPCRQRT